MTTTVIVALIWAATGLTGEAWMQRSGMRAPYTPGRTVACATLLGPWNLFLAWFLHPRQRHDDALDAQEVFGTGREP